VLSSPKNSKGGHLAAFSDVLNLGLLKAKSPNAKPEHPAGIFKKKTIIE